MHQCEVEKKVISIYISKLKDNVSTWLTIPFLNLTAIDSKYKLEISAVNIQLRCMLLIDKRENSENWFTARRKSLQLHHLKGDSLKVIQIIPFIKKVQITHLWSNQVDMTTCKQSQHTGTCMYVEHVRKSKYQSHNSARCNFCIQTNIFWKTVLLCMICVFMFECF